MATGFSISAFFGLDTTGYKAGLRDVETATKSSAARIASTPIRISSDRRFAKGAAGIEQVLLGGDLSQVAPVVAANLAKMFKVPLGSLIGITLGAVAIKQLTEVVGEMNAAVEDLQKTNAKGWIKPGNLGAEGAKREIEEIKKKKDEADALLEGRGFKGRFTQGFNALIGSNAFVRDAAKLFGVNVKDKNAVAEQASAQAQERSEALQSSIVSLAKEEVDIKQKIADGDEEGAAMLKAKLDYQKKLGALQADAAVVGGEMGGMKHQLDREYKLEQDKIRETAALKKNAMKAEIDSAGTEGTPAERAREKLYIEQAKLEADAAQKTGNEKVLALARLAEKQREIRDLEKETQKASDDGARQIQEGTRLLQLEGQAKHLAAQSTRIQFEYEEKINEALEKGHTRQAALLAMQRDRALMNLAVDDTLKSPEQKQQEAQKQNDRERAERLVRKRWADFQTKHAGDGTRLPPSLRAFEKAAREAQQKQEIKVAKMEVKTFNAVDLNVQQL